MKNERAFTLIELLVVLAVISILASLLLPALGTAKRKSHQILCVSRLSQLAKATIMYADDFDDQCPPVRRQTSSNWGIRLKPYYEAGEIIQCPSYDRRNNHPWDKNHFIINGWNDYLNEALSAEEFSQFTNGVYSRGMRLSDVRQPSETVLFGEKRANSGHFHMDFYQGYKGNDIEEIEQRRHKVGKTGSNYAFVDGRVELLGFGESVTPVNLWATSKQWRNAPALPIELLK
ncbi:MAG: type II secretion system GspH family protein [Verrucomicrobia bacterium]|nr:type II secretion system GspH family protein [Verrucomicrobiota bacterium]